MKNMIPNNAKILGKSSGVSLHDHTQHLFDELNNLLSNDFLSYKMKLLHFLTDDEIDYSHTVSLSLHDWGKSHATWQKHCKSGNLISVGLRHEMVYIFKIINHLHKKLELPFSIKSIEDNIDKYYFIIVGILAHHGNLSKGKKDKINKTFDSLSVDEQKMLDKNNMSFYDFLYIILDKVKRDNHYLVWHKQAYFRYLLQLSDKRASIKESINITLPSFKKYDVCLDNITKLRYLQELAKNNKGDITILRSPTGQGKTLASLLWAKDKIDDKKADRLVISMPTQFTSNSLSKSVSAYIEDTNVQHGNSKYFYKDEHIYKWVRTLQSSVSVSTIDHLLISMSLNSEENQHTLYNLTNSCFVIDEADFYDNFILSNILELIYFLRKLNVPILIMSATLPDSFVSLIENRILLEEKNYLSDLKILDDTSDSDRTRVSIQNITEDYDYTILTTKKTAIVYCNTIERVMDTYQTLIGLGIPDERIVVYHSSFTENDKRVIEDMIIYKLGELAWKEGRADGIVIMSQIGELSINISADYMVSDICPIDRLIQRFGRGCRFHFLENKICEVDIIIPTKNNEYYPAPYGDYKMRERCWVENKAIGKTREILVVGEYNYHKYLDMVNIVYSDMIIDNDSIINSRKLYDLNKGNIFFNKGIKLDEEINEHDWKTRNINPQVRIYLGEINNDFKSYDSFKYEYQNNSVNVPFYKFNPNILNGNIFKIIVKIKDKEEIVYCLKENCYSKKFGVSLINQDVFI